MARTDHDLDISIEVSAEKPADELYSLRTWLLAEQEMRGRVRMVERTPAPGTMGSVPESLLIALGPGGAATVLASATIAWIRHRTSDISVRLSRADGSMIEVQGRRIRELSAAEVSAQAERLGQMLSREADTAPGQADKPD